MCYQGSGVKTYLVSDTFIEPKMELFSTDIFENVFAVVPN